MNILPWWRSGKSSITHIFHSHPSRRAVLGSTARSRLSCSFPGAALRPFKSLEDRVQNLSTLSQDHMPEGATGRTQHFQLNIIESPCSEWYLEPAASSEQTMYASQEKGGPNANPLLNPSDDWSATGTPMTMGFSMTDVVDSNSTLLVSIWAAPLSIFRSGKTSSGGDSWDGLDVFKALMKGQKLRSVHTESRFHWY